MNTNILNKLRICTDGISAVKSFKDFLSSKVDVVSAALNSVAELTAIAIENEQSALTLISTKIPNDLTLPFQDVDLSTGLQSVSAIKLQALATACISGLDTIPDAFDEGKTIIVDNAISAISSQITAAKCAIEMLGTLAENSVGGFIEAASNLVEDYSARLSVSIGASNSQMISTSQQFMSMLMRSSSPLKDRAIAIIKFFGFDQTADEDWSGITRSDFTDITGVTPVLALVNSISSAFQTVLSDLFSTIGMVTRNAMLIVLGTMWKISSSIVDTLIGKHDAYDKSILSIGHDLSLSHFGPSMYYPMRSSGILPEAWISDGNLDDFKNRLINMYIASYAKKNDREAPVVDVSTETLLSLCQKTAMWTWPGDLIAGVPAWESQMSIMGLNKNILSHVLIALYWQYYSESRMRINLWILSHTIAERAVLEDFWQSFSSNGAQQNLDYVLDEVYSAIVTYDSLSFMDSSLYLKIPDRSYIKIRLIGAYLYFYRTGNEIISRFQWIPINPSALKLPGTSISRYMTAGWFDDQYMVSFSSDVVTMPSDSDVAAYVDTDYGDPIDDGAFYQWVLNAKLLTIAQLICISTNSESSSLAALVANLNQISLEKYSVGSRTVSYDPKNGNMPYSKKLYGIWSSMGNSAYDMTNRNLASACAGVDPESTNPYIRISGDIKSAIELFVDHIHSQDVIKAENFLPYTRTHEIADGVYHIRTDTTNAIITGAVVAALLVAAISVAALMTVKYMRKLSYMSQAKADIQAFEGPSKANLKKAWGLQKKANIIDSITNAISSTVSSASSGAATSITGATMMATSEAIDKTIASELSVNESIASADPQNQISEFKNTVVKLIVGD